MSAKKIETPSDAANPPDAAKAPKGKKAAKATKPKPEAKAKPAAEAKPKKVSAIDAAARVLQEKGEALNCKEMIDAMAAKGYWTSPGGQTPHATLYSAILREMKVKAKESRFKKSERGKFVFAG